MTIASPCYRLCGDLSHEHNTPSGVAVQYSMWIQGFDPDRRRHPTFARAAVLRYGQTIRDLLAAGF